MEISTPSAKERQRHRFLNLLLLASALFAALTSVVNLAVFLALDAPQLLPISAGAIVCAILLFAARRLMRGRLLVLASLLVSLVWGGYFILHVVFWDQVLIGLLIGTWILPLLLALNLRSWLHRLSALVPAIIVSVVLVLLNNNPLADRLQTTDLAFMRAVTPIYIAVFGVFVFQLVIGSSHNRGLFTRILAALIMLVLIPIAVLSIISYYNSVLGDNRAAIRLLNQITTEKNNNIQEWGVEQATMLESPVRKSDVFSSILNVLAAYENGQAIPEAQFNLILDELGLVKNQSDFEDIHLMDRRGFVVASTRNDLIGENYGYLEFFWQGKVEPVIISPRYYPPEDQVSIFISRPIRDYSGQVVGVLSGRATIDALLAIINEPVYNNYQSGTLYLVSADGMLLSTSAGRPTQNLQTEGATALLSTLSDGSGSYASLDGTPVIGVYHWNPDLQIGIIAEADQSEVYQQLPGVINTNIAIGVTAFVLAVVASLAIVQSITRPIDTLVHMSQQVVSGNLDARVEIDSEDEIGILARAFNEMTSKLKFFVANLEARVQERTLDLQQRSLELQTAAQIARDASLASNVDDLLNRTARLIRDRFGFYHVGVFLNDNKDEYAVLHAAAGDAGQVMLANKHKLLIGATGIVGYVAKWGEPRIALDVGADAVHFRNPLLPYTRSEMALPLKIGSNILGVLDVQSEKSNAFDENDLTIMGILTDQLAIAIERTRLLQESQQNALALEQALRGQTARAWREYLEHSNKPRGYRYEGSRIEPLDASRIEELKKRASNKPVLLPDGTAKQGTIAMIPIRLRGQVLGGLSVRFTAKIIPPETVQLLEEAANRLSLALENARLIRDAQRSAVQEQQINVISGQIQQSTDLEVILQKTVRELGRALGVPNTFIQVGLLPTGQQEETNP